MANSTVPFIFPSTLNNMMLIDDSCIDNLIHTRLLSKTGFCESLQVFRKAKLALEALLDCVNNGQLEHLPEVILLDLKMPQMDGFEFLDQLAKFPPNSLARTKVIILSCYALSKEELLQVKHDHDNVVLSIDKPLMPKDLHIIKQVLAEQLSTAC